jgi:hypothetical protein
VSIVVHGRIAGYDDQLNRAIGARVTVLAKSRRVALRALVERGEYHIDWLDDLRERMCEELAPNRFAMWADPRERFGIRRPPNA